MPTTVNGIGTHYYGKSNRNVRSGVCRSCRTNTNLESYDTTLWFVVIFVPIIPLGRKRIMDKCPRCSRHYVADKAKYETAKTANVSAMLDQYRAEASPENALALHASLISYHMHDEAEKFRQSALLEYPQNAELRLGLAAHMEQMGRGGDALPLLDSAYELRPDLPAARLGAARVRIRDGRLREAGELLEFLQQPGAAKQFSLAPLEMLAIAYQKAGQHGETLALCTHLLSELPKVGQAASFRRLVTNSERALGRAESILPRKSFSLGRFLGGSDEEGRWRRLTWVGIIVGAVLLVMAGLNEYWRRHRGVVAMNECGRPVQMSIDGGDAVPVDHTARLTLAEGPHHVKISGQFDEEFDIEMATGYFERFARNPAWVIMPGEGTILQEDTIHYAKVPRPGNSKLISGKSFFYAPHIDYFFTSPPHQLEVEKNTSEVTKTCLHAASEPAHVLMAVVAADDRAAALRFAETRLIGNRENVQLLELYVLIAESLKQADRALAYLKKGLDQQPISVPWHRAYQDAAKTGSGQAAIEKQYDDLLKRSPRDARLLYLAGRVAADRQKANRRFRESREADPNLPWPCLALAYDAASSGDWQSCRALGEKSLAGMDHPGSAEMVRQARLALGDFAALEAEYRQKLAQAAGNAGNADIDALLKLYEVLLMQGRLGDAKAALAAWPQQRPETPAEAERCSLSVAYMNGDFRAAPDADGNHNGRYNAYLRLQCLLAGRRVKDALADASLQELLAQPDGALEASVAWELAGNGREAAAWREKAAAACDRGDIQMQRAAALLRAAGPPTAGQLDAAVLPPHIKCLLLTALVQRFPQQKSALSPLAKKLNVGRMPPYQLVRQVVESVSSSPREANAAR
jgi:hypothetical protein